MIWKMTRRITCYVVFVALIWGANTQNEENIRDNKFKSNMTRNDFSNLLSSLIKLNEQRVSVLQRLYKLEDYGVLSEVLRTGDRKPEEGKGNPSNLFLIVMSKNKTDPSRRNIDFEIVDSVPSLDVGSKKVHPKLNFILDSADYISQNTHKENSIETMVGNIQKSHKPKKALLIDDGSKENATAKNKLKDPVQRNEKSSNVLRKTDLAAKKKRKKRNGKSKPYHHPKMFVTKAMEDAISNNNDEYKDREDEHDFSDTLSINNKNHKKSKEKEDENNYSSSFSKEFVEKVPNHKNTEIDSDISIQKVHSNNTPKPKKKSHTPKTKAQGDQHPKFNRNKSILNNSYNKQTVIMEEIETTTEKATDGTNNNQNGKLPSEDKDLEDDNYYGSPLSKEYDENGPNHQNTKIDDYTPKINNSTVQYKQPLNFNRSTSTMEQDTTRTYSTTKTDLTAITARNVIKLVSTVNIDKTSNKNQALKDSKKIEKEKIPTLSSKYASGSGIPETSKDLPFMNYDDNNYAKDDGNKTNKENLGSPDEVEYEDEEAENNTYHGTENLSPPIMVSENVNVKTTLPVKTDSPSHLQDVTENSNKTNKENPGIAKDKTTENPNKYKPKATEDLRIGNKSNAKADNRGDFIIHQKKANEFSIIVTDTGKEEPEEIKQSDNLGVNLKAFDQPEYKPIGREAFQKCLNKKAKKMCCKACISAYKNVCTRLKCTSKAKKALKKECKKSCEKTFKSSSSKYSDKDSDYSGSDNSGSDNSGSDSSDSNSS